MLGKAVSVLLDRKVPAVIIIVLNRRQSAFLDPAKAPRSPLYGLEIAGIKQRPAHKAVILEAGTEWEMMNLTEKPREAEERQRLNPTKLFSGGCQQKAT